MCDSKLLLPLIVREWESSEYESIHRELFDWEYLKLLVMIFSTLIKDWIYYLVIDFDPNSKKSFPI